MNMRAVSVVVSCKIPILATRVRFPDGALSFFCWSGYNLDAGVQVRRELTPFICMSGSLAEWSKALVLGTSPKGRGFESHSCQKHFTDHTQIFKSVVAPGEARTHNPGISLVLSISTVR
mgnify:FL=1